MKRRKGRNKREDHREEIVVQVYEVIVAYFDQEGIPPTIQDVADGCYMSRTNAVRYLDLLEARGYITRIPNVPRSIRLTDDHL